MSVEHVMAWRAAQRGSPLVFRKSHRLRTNERTHVVLVSLYAGSTCTDAETHTVHEPRSSSGYSCVVLLLSFLRKNPTLVIFVFVFLFFSSSVFFVNPNSEAFALLALASCAKPFWCRRHGKIKQYMQICTTAHVRKHFGIRWGKGTRCRPRNEWTRARI